MLLGWEITVLKVKDLKQLKTMSTFLCLLAGALWAQPPNVTQLPAREPSTLVTPPPKLTQMSSRELVTIPGKEATMVTVVFAPGGSQAVQRQDADVFVYVVEGTVIMQVQGGQELTLEPGQTFYEGPDGVTMVARNASITESAKLVVFFLKDEGAPLLAPMK